MLAAHLGRLDYNQFGTLGVWMALTVVAENDNRAAVAGFTDVGFTLSFHRIDVTLLRAAPFAVPRNNSWPLQYDVQAAPVPLDADAMHAMDADAMQAMDALKEEGEEEKRNSCNLHLVLPFFLIFGLSRLRSAAALRVNSPRLNVARKVLGLERSLSSPSTFNGEPRVNLRRGFFFSQS
uniref:Uncharacterized protein n=1 Tax=Ananas comosus var. bracteatus TaxID=296719 RepID=A0A6V7Q7F0_ANACO|nr:unnamed protein product [Ananas comosus var. bracteatus]